MSGHRRVFEEKNEKDPLFDDGDYSEEEEDFTRRTSGTFKQFTDKAASNVLSMTDL